MTTYFVDSVSGNDANDGLSFANAKLTLNGAEDIPVVPSDIVKVTPGTYRELLTLDVNGTSGNIITYIGDVTGEDTDGVGGKVRITGADSSEVETRASCITSTNIDFRTFRGFRLDGTTSHCVDMTSSEDIIFEDCVVVEAGADGLNLNGTGQASITVRRCIIATNTDAGVNYTAGSNVTGANHLVENCLLLMNAEGIDVTRVGDISVNNCLFLANTDDGIDYKVSGAGAPDILTVLNSQLIRHDSNALESTTAGDIVENFNNFFANGADRSNVAVGADSTSLLPVLDWPILFSGLKLESWMVGELAPTSPLAAKTGSSQSTEDIFGFTRPVTAAKISWGPIQFQDTERETTTVDAGSVSIKFSDYARHQIWIPTTNVSTTFTVRARRETDYAGTNPRMIIKQPGVADDVTTDVGAVNTWNTLSTTLTPASSPPYVVMELVSSNTATSGSFAAFFDTIGVN